MTKVYPYRPLRLRLHEIAQGQHQWNLRYLSDLIDVPYQTVLSWNQGRSMPKMPMLVNLLKILNVTFEELMDASLLR
jgi:hypothetical protein